MYETEQEEFWSGDFGNEYADRNRGDKYIAANLALFSDILSNTNGVSSILEFGCNIGLNLRSLHALLPDSKLHGIEINKKAVELLEQWGKAEITQGSILDIEMKEMFDLTLIKGVLIHINPDRRMDVYRQLYERSNKYICIAEYYNPTPVEVSYRGHSERLFKRDFAGELLDMYPELELVNYGFSYHRDPVFPQDDINWFLLRKKM